MLSLQKSGVVYGLALLQLFKDLADSACGDSKILLASINRDARIHDCLELVYERSDRVGYGKVLSVIALMEDTWDH